LAEERGETERTSGVNGTINHCQGILNKSSIVIAETSMRGLMYVMEPLAPEKGVATDMFAEPPGKRSFMVSFWIPRTTASPEAFASTRRDHEAFLASLIADKRAGIEMLDSTNVPDSAGTLFLDAGSLAEVVAMVGEDPAVKAKMVEFEVLGE
jgi:hypothetical protein